MPRFEAASISITSSEFAGRNFAARIALVAGSRRRTLHAVERLGQNARRGRFAHAARAGKNVRMRHAVRCESRSRASPSRAAARRRPQTSAGAISAQSPDSSSSGSRVCQDSAVARLAPIKNDERNFGYSAAHDVIPVPLLPSGPGGVRGASLHRARSSTHRRCCRHSAAQHRKAAV